MMHLLRAFGYAWKGIVSGFISERNMKLHVIAAIAVIGLGIYCAISSIEWLALIFCIAGVFVAELFNTALEKLTNLVSPGHHPEAGAVKDLAAGAVLLMAIAAVVTGAVIFIPKLF
jgi:diacylglycerol kinase (ATP)